MVYLRMSKMSFWCVGRSAVGGVRGGGVWFT